MMHCPRCGKPQYEAPTEQSGQSGQTMSLPWPGTIVQVITTDHTTLFDSSWPVFLASSSYPYCTCDRVSTHTPPGTSGDDVKSNQVFSLERCSACGCWTILETHTPSICALFKDITEAETDSPESFEQPPLEWAEVEQELEAMMRSLQSGKDGMA